jgi:hypothetical protein
MTKHHSIGLFRSAALIMDLISLDQASVGAVGKVVHFGGAIVHLGKSGISVGEIVQVMSITSRGSAIVQLTSDKRITLNPSLAKCIYISLNPKT